MPEFTHLHVHSEYSILDGLSRVNDLVLTAKNNGMQARALTDHGVLHGAIEFYEAAHEHGIKPIVGVEAYVAPRKMTDRDANTDRSSAHLILLAKNDVGYRNLLQLTSKAHLEGFYYKPRIDHDLLAKHSEGLVALSGCGSGEVPWAIRQERMDEARRVASFYRDLFGPESYYLEMQSHGIDFQDAVNRGVLDLAKELDLKIVCTNDSHYTARDDFAAQDLLLCIQMNAQVDDPKRMKAYTADHYVKSPDEMFQLFGHERPDALANTMAIAEMCNLQLTFGRLDFPALHFIPEGESAQEFLARMCWDNLPRRYERITPEIEERLRYELDVVRTTGFAAYILFVWDFVDYARRQDILCGPRGSAAGSIILYCLGITTIDPIAHGLTFERFLNPERIQMPDIDMDFADSRRDEVIEYVAQRYGRDHVAQIVTFGRLLARAAIRDAGRALGYPLAEVDRVAKLIPTLPVGMTLDRALASAPELKQLYDEQDHVRRLIDSARQVEGSVRHASTHAAGIVVSGEPLVCHVPLQRGARGENVIMTQYEMHALETIGLLKMDFLGLTNLTLLENALKIIEETRGQRPDLQHLPTDDPATFEMLSNADSTGVFQLEGTGMRRTLREFRPSTVDHLAAIVALYRPGPMAHIPTYVAAKDGRKPITYLHAKLETILEGTYGVIVYQDQVLQIVQAIAGFTLGQADVLRRAMGKKIASEMKGAMDSFLKGADQNGVDPQVAAKIWEYIEPFAGYAFNRAHAYCYAYIAYQTAYLKCNYPAEYMAAMLSTQGDDSERVIAAAGECKRLGIPLRAPDVNLSHVGFSVEGMPHPQAPAAQANPQPPTPNPKPQAVRFGLGAIKNVGGGAAQVIVAEREAHGPFKSVDDLCSRVDLRAVNKRVLEAMAKAGALHDLGPCERILAGLDRIIAGAQATQRAAGIGQQSLFGDDSFADAGALPPANPPTSQERAAWEKESLGFFLTNHPYEAAAKSLARHATTNTSQITEELAGERVTLGAAVMRVRRIVTKRQETMAVVQLEDLHGTIEAVVFPRTYAVNPDLWRDDAILLVKGRVEVRGLETQDEEVRGVPQILVESAEAWDPSQAIDDDPPDDPGEQGPTQDDGTAWPPGDDYAEPSLVASEPGPSARSETIAPETQTPPTPTMSAAVAEAPEGYLADLAYDTPDVTDVDTSEVDADPIPTRIAILFRESEDRTADMDRLHRLHGALARSSGADPYMIVFERAGERRQLVGEHLRMAYCPQLHQEVETILGSGSLQLMAT